MNKQLLVTEMVNRRTGILRRFLRSDRGAYQIEFALVFPVLILLSLGLLEFSLLAFDYQRAAEATRRAVRFVIVGRPVANTSQLLEGAVIVCTSAVGTVSCTGGSPADLPEYPAGTGDANFQAMLLTMQAIYPLVKEEDIRVTYESTTVGSVTSAGGIIPLVTVEVFNLTHVFVVGKVIGLASITLPDFKTSILGSGRTVNSV